MKKKKYYKRSDFSFFFYFIKKSIFELYKMLNCILNYSFLLIFTKLRIFPRKFQYPFISIINFLQLEQAEKQNLATSDGE